MILEEKQFLLRKYMKAGYEFEEAQNKVNVFKNYLKQLQIKLEKKNKTEVDIEKRFQEEFEKLCMKLEAEREG